MPGLHVDFSKKRSRTQLNGLSVAKGPRGMAERSIYMTVDMVFPYLAGYIGLSTGWTEETALTNVHVLSVDVMLSMTRDNSRDGWNDKQLSCCNS